MRLTADDRIRKSIAQVAAKLVAQNGLEDFLIAKKKAAQQLNVNNKRLLPSNSEIEDALIEYQSLFHNEKQQQTLYEFRTIAYRTMHLLEKYKPLLTGSVLSGTANEFSEIIIHVFSDSPEVISLYLENNGIPVSLCERRLKIEKKSHIYFTTLKFIAGDINIVLIILPHIYQRKAPIDPITQRAMKRAPLSTVKRLIDDQ